MSKKINIKYPARLSQDGKLLTTYTGDNFSRIRMVLSYRPGLRPHEPRYGSLLSDIEQKPQNRNNSIITSAILKFRDVLFTYCSKYFIVESYEVSIDKYNIRQSEVILKFKSLVRFIGTVDGLGEYAPVNPDFSAPSEGDNLFVPLNSDRLITSAFKIFKV